MRLTTILAGAAASALIAQAAAAQSVSPAAGDKPAPVEAYGRLEAMSDVHLSQDGKRIAYIGAVGDDHVFVIQEVGGPILQTVTANHRKVLFITFADPDHVLMGIRGTQHMGGDEDTYELSAIILYNLKTHTGAQVFPRAGVVVDGQPAAVIHKDGHTYGYFFGKLTAGANGVQISGPRSTDETALYKTDLDSLVTTLELKSENHVADVAVGPDGAVAARVEESDHGKSWRVLKGADASEVLASGRSVFGFPDLVAYGRTTGSVIIKQPEDGDFDPPREIDLASGKMGPPLVQGADASVLQDRASYLTVGYRVGGFAQDAYFLDPAIDAKWQGVRAAFKDERVALVSYDAGFDRWVVEVDGPHDSGRYFLVDLKTAKATQLGAIYPQIKPDQVGPFSWFDYTARDGTKLRGVLTLPPGRDPKNLPLVMMPHGGPGNGTYDSPHFDWWAQAMASRGYAVFQPDFRGSGGLGQSFERAGWGQWGRIMETDVSDAIPALAAKGIVDPARVCIVGWSYGGYATLAGVTVQHGLYKCAIAGGAVSDLNGMMWWSQDRSENKLDPQVRYWSQAMGLKSAGDPAGADYSPAKLADRADAPIMLIHGKDDTVVPFSQSEEMAKALRAAGKTVDLVVLPTSDHWIGNGSQANRTAMLTASVDWLEKYNPSN
ncbi:MAG TPA: alpha/beta fold hydrolase [Caulobacteraceae bacterium]